MHWLRISQVRLWDVAQQLGRMAPGGWAPPGPDGLYQPLQPASSAAVNGLSMRWLCDGPGPVQVNLVTVHEDGCLNVFRAGQSDPHVHGE